MYTRRQLICEANPFTWMSQVGSGIKKGVGMAINNPITRAASELQKAALPGAGRTREQIGRMLGNIFRSPHVKSSKFYRNYRQIKQKDPAEFTRQTTPNNTKDIPIKEISAISTKYDRIPVKAVVNKKVSQQFGLVDNNGDILFTFHPFILQDKDNPVENSFGKDTGFIVWDAKTGNQEIIDQPLRTSNFAKEPNFIAL